MQLFDMTRAEVGLVVFIFALVYSAGLLPKLIARLSPAAGGRADKDADRGAGDDGDD